MIEHIATTRMIKLAEGGYTTNAEIANMIETQDDKHLGRNIGGVFGGWGGAQLGGDLSKKLIQARNLTGWKKLLALSLGTGLGAGSGLVALRRLGGLVD